MHYFAEGTVSYSFGRDLSLNVRQGGWSRVTSVLQKQLELTLFIVSSACYTHEEYLLNELEKLRLPRVLELRYVGLAGRKGAMQGQGAGERVIYCISLSFPIPIVLVGDRT